MLSDITVTPDQQRHATMLLKVTLNVYDEWIVINLTLRSLATLAQRDDRLRQELPEIRQMYAQDVWKSVVRRASRLLREMGR